MKESRKEYNRRVALEWYNNLDEDRKNQVKDRMNRYARDRWRNDPEYRKRQAERQKEYMAENPEVYENHKERQKKYNWSIYTNTRLEEEGSELRVTRDHHKYYDAWRQKHNMTRVPRDRIVECITWVIDNS